MVRTLYDCPDQSLGEAGKRGRIIVATHQAQATRSRVGLTRADLVEAWQIISKWVWNLRLEWGHQLHPDSARTTEFAPAQVYGPAAEALPWKAGRISGRDFVPQADGMLRYPAGQSLRGNARRREANGSLRAGYAASMRSCRPCPLREQCQWQGGVTKKPRQVSILLHPLAVGSALLRLRMTGADGSIGGRACSCSQANAWRCRWRRPSLPALATRRLPCPGRIIAFRGESGWLAMHEPQELARSPSSCSGSQKASQPSSAC